MWMSLVAMKVWMRGRSESLIAFQAASMSAFDVRASPQITGPCTSRAIACTDSKSPGEVIGKPASITSTPRRESWCAISTFSCAVERDARGLLAVAKRRVEDPYPVLLAAFVAHVVALFFVLPAFPLSLRLAAATRYSPRGGRRRRRRRSGTATTSRKILARSQSPSQLEDHLADVLAGVQVAVGIGALLEREGPRHHRPQPALVDPRAAAVRCTPRATPCASHSVSMFSPITALDSFMSLSGPKRGIWASTRSARIRLRRSPACTSDAPKHTSRPAGPQQREALLEAAPAHRVHHQVERLLLPRDPAHLVHHVVGAVVHRVVHSEAPDGVVLRPARPRRTPPPPRSSRSAWPRSPPRPRRSGSAPARPARRPP